jgi:hypothetical protein
VADHRLTVETVRQMFAVEREMLELLKEVPELETRIGELRIWRSAARQAKTATGANVAPACLAWCDTSVRESRVAGLAVKNFNRAGMASP